MTQSVPERDVNTVTFGEISMKVHDGDVKLQAYDEAIKAIDDCWRRMHHGQNCHHHTMKRDLFLRFRRTIETLRENQVNENES
jgi:hypothetical protein